MILIENPKWVSIKKYKKILMMFKWNNITILFFNITIAKAITPQSLVHTANQTFLFYGKYIKNTILNRLAK